MSERRVWRRVHVVTGAVLLIGALANPAWAHEHEAGPAHGGEGQFLANGQLHGAFVDGKACGGDPAAYGLESAHHGPDSGTPGKADGDGCYQSDDTVGPPNEDVANPAIR